MLDILPSHVRKILLKYDFIKEYLDGRMTKKDFLIMLEGFQEELLSKGVEKKYIMLLSSTDDETEFHRKATHSRFVRFAREIGLDIATKEDKVRWLKSISVEKFLDVLSISAGLLRGIFSFQKWKDRREDRAIVGALAKGITLDPPDNPQLEFEKFFKLMVRDITEYNIDIWAVKLYFAIICSHMFPNGNGRLARNAYFLLKSNGLLDEKRSSKRTQQIAEAIYELDIAVYTSLFQKEGLKFKYDLEYLAGENCTDNEADFYGYEDVQYLKYIAAKRVLEKRREWKNQKFIGMKFWPEIKKNEFKIMYQKVRIEWFWQCIELAGKHYKYFASKLDKALIK